LPSCLVDVIALSQHDDSRTSAPIVYNPPPNPKGAATMRYAILRYARVAILVALALFAVSPLRAQAPSDAPPPAENLAAARELVAVMKATDQFKVLLPSIFQALKQAIVQGRPEVAKDYDAIVPIVTAGAMKRLDAFAEVLATVYARNFSVDELHDLIAFYKTPTGQKLIARQPVIAHESLIAGQQFGQELIADLRQQIDDELKKRGDAN
jgi:uncharacterized protein